MSLAKMICLEARNLIFRKAVNAGDGFRQWVYPRLPKKYEMRTDLDEEIERRMLQGKSAQQIADELYREHS